MSRMFMIEHLSQGIFLGWGPHARTAVIVPLFRAMNGRRAPCYFPSRLHAEMEIEKIAPKPEQAEALSILSTD